MSASIGLSFPAQIRRAADAVRVALRTALDIALPTLCPACREPVEGRGLCPTCWSKLSFITRPYCERLGIPFVYDPGPGILSMEAIADPPAYRRARAAVRFDEISRALVHALKYGDRLDLAPMMGRWISHAGGELLAEADALVPVPLHWRRLWARRFNQSAMACRHHFIADRRADRCRCAQARQADRATGRIIQARTCRQCSGRLPRAAGWTGRDGGAPSHSGRRCAHIRRHGRRLRPGAPACRGRQRRCPDFCQGCRPGANVHITI
jgi:predicted amidophosphoribosyltransferase